MLTALTTAPSFQALQESAARCPSSDSQIAFFIVGVTCAFIVGYSLAIGQLTGRKLSHVARKGFWDAMRTNYMKDYVEQAAREERQIFALHFLLAIKEIGGNQYHMPMSRESLVGLYKLAEVRMLEAKKQGKSSHAS